jgi:hypothetical protein
MRRPTRHRGRVDGRTARMRACSAVTLRRWLAVLALALASVPALAGCQPNSAPLEPADADRVGPAIMIAEGTGAAGDYRAWIYRNRRGLTCLIVASTSGNNGANCGAGEEGAMGLVGSCDNAGVFVPGGRAGQPPSRSSCTAVGTVTSLCRPRCSPRA